MQQEPTGEMNRKFLGTSNGCLYRLTRQEDSGGCLCIGSLIRICGMTGSLNELPGRAESLRILNQRLSNFLPLPLVSSWATRKQLTLIWATVGYSTQTHWRWLERTITRSVFPTCVLTEGANACLAWLRWLALFAGHHTDNKSKSQVHN